MIIWTLGNYGTDSDKEVFWNSEFPNFADPDVLIIDLTTFTKPVLDNIDYGKLQDAKIAITDKFLHGGKIIVITAANFTTKPKYTMISNTDILPIFHITKNVPIGTGVNYSKHNANPHMFSNYLDKVKKFSFYIERFDFSQYHSRARAISVSDDLVELSNERITDNAQHILGSAQKLRFNPEAEIYFLPPPTECATSEAIKLLVSAFKEQNNEDETIIPPTWASKIKVSGTIELNDKLTKLEKETEKLQNEIVNTKNNIGKLDSQKKLLFATGKPLEKSVRDAFRILGFDEIKQVREVDKEDWFVDIKSESDYKHAVIEVEGSKNHTSIEKLDQCHRWVNDYFLENKEVKGIFVSNQFRELDYTTSKQQKIEYADNQRKYAQTRHICIIPSCVLFEIVNEVLNGKKIPREELEKIFIETDGILTKI